MSDDTTDQPATEAEEASPFAPPPPPPDPTPPPPAADAGAVPVAPADKPEVLIGGAFAGGFLAALILKRLGRR